MLIFKMNYKLVNIKKILCMIRIAKILMQLFNFHVKIKIKTFKLMLVNKNYKIFSKLQKKFKIKQINFIDFINIKKR